jgi:IMP dehydrogenase
MAEVIGDYVGTTYKDFLVLPDGYTLPEHSPDKADISTALAGVTLQKPFLPAAMRSVVGKEMALEASKLGMMAVVPRGLNADIAAGIVRHVKENEVKIGAIETVENPTCAHGSETIAEVLARVHGSGHTNIPVVDKYRVLQGMFQYNPIEHDRMDPQTSVVSVMVPLKNGRLDVYHAESFDSQINDFRKGKKRSAVVVDNQNRLVKLVFLQQDETYKIGGAIDTHPDWEKRAAALVEAGADMIFTDTSDGYTKYALEVVQKLKQLYPKIPVCGGNIVTPDGFRKLADAGADVIKIGMGSGSICTTNVVLGVGAPPFYALKTVADARDGLAKTGKYIPLIMDGGIGDTWDIAVAMTHADAVMGGKIFAGFHESAGALIEHDGVRVKEHFGEGSRRAAMTTGDMKRYHMGAREPEHAIYQGVDGVVPYRGRLKPGVEEYAQALRLALSHTACATLKEYRERARLVRLSEGAKKTANVHGIVTIGK